MGPTVYLGTRDEESVYFNRLNSYAIIYGNEEQRISLLERFIKRAGPEVSYVFDENPLIHPELLDEFNLKVTSVGRLIIDPSEKDRLVSVLKKHIDTRMELVDRFKKISLEDVEDKFRGNDLAPIVYVVNGTHLSSVSDIIERGRFVGVYVVFLQSSGNISQGNIPILEPKRHGYLIPITV